MKHTEEQRMPAVSTDNRDLIRELLDCALACEACGAACLNEDNVTMMARCIELDRDCAELCMQGVKLFLRDSELAPSFLTVCEEACRMCADECSKHEYDHCQHCADACERCAEACREKRSTLSVDK